MDLVRSGTPRQRAAHYQDQSDRLRQLAEMEAVERIRQLLLAVAQQYQELAIILSG